MGYADKLEVTLLTIFGGLIKVWAESVWVQSVVCVGEVGGGGEGGGCQDEVAIIPVS